MNKIKAAKWFFGLFIITMISWASFPQDRPKDEIRILIDRAPITLDPSQTPDNMARKIFPLLQELHYQVAKDALPEDFILIPPDSISPKLHFQLVKDDLTRSVLFLRNRADVLYNTLSLSKENWMKDHGFRVFSAQGHNLGYLGFQTTDPLLKDKKIREAIAHALPLKEWIHFKFFDWVTLSPDAPSFDLELSNRLLDEAGYLKGKDGVRFSLLYLTTPIREGNEMAYMNREALAKIGIHVEIKLLETSLFFSKLKSGNFQLFGSFFPRNTPEDSLFEYFSEQGKRNYFRYTPPNPKSWSFQDLKTSLLEDRPVIPFFEWKHGLVVSNRTIVPEFIESKLDDSFRFLATLRLK